MIAGSNREFSAECAIAVINFDYYSVGYQTGNLVVRILKGARPGTVPVAVAVAEDAFLHVNARMAEEMGVRILEDPVDRGKLVIV